MISPALVSLVKLGAGFVVSSGVSTMVGFAAKSSVPKVAPHVIRRIPSLVKGYHLFQKVAIPAGAACLAGMAAEQAVKYSDKKIDETVKDVETLNQMINDVGTIKKHFEEASEDLKSESEEDK